MKYETLKETFYYKAEFNLKKSFKHVWYFKFFIAWLYSKILKISKDLKVKISINLLEFGSSYWAERGHAYNLIRPIIALRKIFTATRLHHSGLPNNYGLTKWNYDYTENTRRTFSIVRFAQILSCWFESEVLRIDWKLLEIWILRDRFLRDRIRRYSFLNSLFFKGPLFVC